MPLDPTPVPNELRGMRIALLISGGIAAYKVVDLASALTQAGARVRVAMTSSAMRFVGPPTFQGVTGNPVATGMWAADGSPEPHVPLEGGVEPLVEDQPERHVQPCDERDRRRHRRVEGRLALARDLPVEVEAR